MKSFFVWHLTPDNSGLTYEPLTSGLWPLTPLSLPLALTSHPLTSGTDLWPLTSGPLTSGHWPQAPDIWPLTSGLWPWPLAPDLWPLNSDLWHLTSGTWPLAPDLWPTDLSIFWRNLASRTRRVSLRISTEVKFSYKHNTHYVND